MSRSALDDELDELYAQIAAKDVLIKNLEISLENRLQELTKAAAAYRELKEYYGDPTG
jgi:DNA repair exonuclease SbcCD ATPase subunit